MPPRSPPPRAPGGFRVALLLISVASRASLVASDATALVAAMDDARVALACRRDALEAAFASDSRDAASDRDADSASSFCAALLSTPQAHCRVAAASVACRFGRAGVSTRGACDCLLYTSDAADE